MFSGEEALALGFATENHTDPLARAAALAHEIAGKNPHAIRAAKALFNRAPWLGLDEVLRAESHEQHGLIGSRNQVEAVASQLEKRQPDYTNP